MSNEELRQEIRHAARRLIATTSGLMNDHEVVCAKLEEAKSLATAYRSFLYGCDKHKLWQGVACIGCIEEENTRLRAEVEQAKVDRNKTKLQEQQKYLPVISKLRAALRAIATYDELSVWNDSRDDAADDLLDLAREALEEQPAKP